MAINLFNKYGSRANPPSIDYPQGSVKNRSAPDVKDGTPLDADWANDHQGFFQSILSYFGVTANGTPDKVGASQYFDALMSDPSESKRGMPLAATNAEVAAGTNNGKMVTPAGLKSHLGTAATRNVGTASGNVMEVGAGGILGLAPTYSENLSGGLATYSPVALPSRYPASAYDFGSLLSIHHPYSGVAAEIAVTHLNKQLLFRGSRDVDWTEVYHTGNTGNAVTRNVGTTAGTVAAGDDPRFDTYAVKSNNLSDLTNKPQAIQNLGLQLPLGQGQTWQNVTSSRVEGTTYTNTTGRSIVVNVSYSSVGNNAASHSFVVGGVTVGESESRFNESRKISFTSAVVPAGATYIVIAYEGVLSVWAELR